MRSDRPHVRLSTPPAADVDSPSCSPTDVVYHELGSICCTRSRPARKRIAGVAVRLGMTRAVAAHVTRSHRAVAYLLLLVYHLGVGPWPYRHVLVRLRNLLIHLLASRPATRSEGVTRSVSSPPVALRLAARCMSLLLLLSSPRVTSAGKKKENFLRTGGLWQWCVHSSAPPACCVVVLCASW